MSVNKYIKRMLFILLIITISLCYVGCSKDAKVEETTHVENKVNTVAESKGIMVSEELEVKEILDLQDDDFVIICSGINIVLGGVYDDIVTNDNIVSTRSSNGKNVNDIYVYDNFKIIVNPAENNIIGIDLITSQYQTSRGIKVGDSLSDIVGKYGDYDNSSINELREFYMYYYNEKVLTFCTDTDKKVVSIKYEYI